jgi:hypothetical protein
MKKFFFTFLFLFLFLVLIGAALWSHRTSLISHFLTKRVGTKVSLEAFHFVKEGCKIHGFHIFNPPPCKTDSAFFATKISCYMKLRSVFEKRVVIDKIHLQEIDLGIEFFNKSGDENNWTYLLSDDTETPVHSKPYLIRSLVFDNINATITDMDGKVKKVPTIKHLEFHDISDESGFPIAELEKAILQAMIRSIFKNLGIKTIMNMIKHPTTIPKLFHLPFSFHPFNEKLPIPAQQRQEKETLLQKKAETILKRHIVSCPTKCA